MPKNGRDDKSTRARDNAGTDDNDRKARKKALDKTYKRPPRALYRYVPDYAAQGKPDRRELPA